MTTGNLRDILDATTTSRGRDGELWCEEGVGQDLQWRLTARTRDLGTLVWQSVRLGRLMALASKNIRKSEGLYEFLYKQLPSLRARFFRQQIAAALSRGALTGVTSPKYKGKELAGVWFEEPEMNAASKKFDLEFWQMPLAAALIDVINNRFVREARGWWQSLSERPCTVSAEDVARAINDELQAWLREQLGLSEHHQKQANIIRRFLSDTQRSDADAIDDQTVLDFWTCAVNERVEGFLKYRSAARKVLLYRDTLRLAAVEARLSSPDGFSDDPAEAGTVSLNTLKVDSPEDGDGSPGLAAATLQDGNWLSPLVRLQETGGSGIRWLRSRKDRERFADIFLDTAAGDDKRDEEEDEEAGTGDAEDGKSLPSLSLFSRTRPNEQFFQTLVRYACLGRLQNRIIQQVKNGNGEAPGIEFENDGYEKLKETYSVLATQLDKTIAAAVGALMDRRDPTAILLGDALDPAAMAVFRLRFADTELRELQDSEDDASNVIRLTDREGMLIGRFAQFIGEPRNDLGRKISAARRDVQRAGFRKQDVKDAAMGKELAAGADALIDLAREFRRVCSWFEDKNLSDWYERDRQTFQAVFNQLYPGRG